MGCLIRENQRPMSQGKYGTMASHLYVRLVQDDFLPYC